MKIQKLALLTALVIGLAPLADAQRSSRGYTSHRSSVTVQANLGHLGIRLGFGGLSPIANRGPSRYVTSRYRTPARVWIEGYYRTDYRKVLVQARQEKRWVPARYETRYDECGEAYSVLVQDGYWSLVTIPARYENRPVKSWIPGRYEYRR